MISIVIPVYNEEEAIPHLVKKLSEVIKTLGKETEVIFVDDGSRDNSLSALKESIKREKLDQATIVEFKRNYGQTAAIMAGFDYSNGDIIVTMDADLQNDPADIPKLLELMDEYDLVTGWRKDRKDPFFSRVLPSRIANWIISKYLGLHLHDYGCTLKAYRRDIVKNIKLYGEMHRFLPVFAKMEGAKIKEIPVNHNPRKYGKTKYGLSRIGRVLLDMLTVKFLMAFFTSPIHFIGGWGLFSLSSGILFGIVTIVMKLVWKIDITGNPFLYLSGTLFILGIQLLLLGLIAEVEIRTYFEAQKRKPYSVKSVEKIEEQ